MNDIIVTIQNIFNTIERFINDHKLELFLGVLTSLIATVIGLSFSKLKKYSSTLIKSIFNLFKSTRKKLESIEIEGATVISKIFITKVVSIGKKQKYHAGDFYLAKQFEYCQWYGIMNNWDIERDAYKKIKEEIKSSFADEFRQPKIISIIHGRGGCGKSTLLRRLAVESIMEDFCVLWINDKEIAKFYEKGINQLSNYSNVNILILIEDWYRIKQNTENAHEIINSICSYSNVRVILGDRTIDNSISKEHVFNPDENIIELNVRENQKTIAKILDIIPRWKATAESLLSNDNDYKSSLYLILWVIARTYQSRNKIINENKIKSEGLIGHFQTIVESDLRVIAEHYSGLAKMLYYLGSVYSERKIYLGFDVFIKLADLFKENGNTSKLAFASKEIKPVLDIYINKTVGLIKSAGQLPLVAFNHDILADEGLSKVQINGWQKFDHSIVLQMLPLIINEGDDFSASNYLYYSIIAVDRESFPNQEILNYVKTLFDKGNSGSYIRFIFNNKIKIDETEKSKYTIEILNDFLKRKYPIDVICYCLNHEKFLPSGKKAASDILSQKEFWKLPDQIVTTAMKISKDEAELKKAASDILSQKEFWKLHYQIVTTAMKVSKDEAELKKAASSILSQKEFWKIYDSIVSMSMKISKDEAELKKAASIILSQKEFWKLPFEMVTTAMKITRDESELKKAASDILSQKEFWKFPHAIVTTAMKISKDEAELKKAASDILSQKDFYKLPKEIVTTAMKISEDEAELKKAASDILSQKDFYKLPKEIVTTAMKISEDEAELKKAASDILSQKDFYKLPKEIVSTALRFSKDIDKATNFLNNWEKTDWGIIYQALYCFTETTIHPQFVIDIVNTIINSKSAGQVQYFRYTQLLKIPFYGITLWEKECNDIITSYPRSNVSLLNNILRSHRSHPERIYKVCEMVLKQWQIEIIKPLKHFYREPHYGDNIKIALGHPDLKILAKQTAQEILDADAKKQGSIPKYLLEITNSIISENEFPEWNLEFK